MVAPYHPDSPSDCPTSLATSPKGPVYRAVRKFPVEANDLLSDAERNRKGTDKANCINWGLSVWLTPEAVQYARDILPFTRERYIVDLVPTAADGRIQHTPTGNQPEHHTFWRFAGRDLTSQCQMLLAPVTE